MALPSNIRSFLRKCSEEQRKAANKIGAWCDKLGHSIVGGTAVGKYYDTIVLDLTPRGGQISIEECGFGKTRSGFPGVEINGVEIKDGSKSSFETFKKEIEKVFGQKNASAKIARELKIARNLCASEPNQLQFDIDSHLSAISQQIEKTSPVLQSWKRFYSSGDYKKSGYEDCSKQVSIQIAKFEQLKKKFEEFKQLVQEFDNLIE